MNYWLFKTEPDAFSFDDLLQAPNQTEIWDGVRNYQARNLMRDDIKKGDLVFFYHSRIPEPAIVGIGKIAKAGYPDHTALDPNSKYFDAKSEEKGESRWVMVDIKAYRRLKRVVTLKEVKEVSDLAEMKLVQKGQRLSIQPVSEYEWKIICELGGVTKL